MSAAREFPSEFMDAARVRRVLERSPEGCWVRYRLPPVGSDLRAAHQQMIRNTVREVLGPQAAQFETRGDAVRVRIRPEREIGGGDNE